MGSWMPGRSPRIARVVIACLLAVLALAPSLVFSQTAPPQNTAGPSSGWEEWFFGQRRYGLGYIPDDALASAVAQRDGSSYGLEALRPREIHDNRWISIGPVGINSLKNDLVSGRIPSLAIDPLNPSTVYLAAAAGGVWKSTNRGKNWTPLTDQLPSPASGAVAVDPFSGEVWYGTGELNFCRDCFYGAGVYRSPDGGTTWNRVNPESFLSSPTSVVRFDPRNQGTLFIGRSSALWKSSDGGQNWRSTLLGVVTDFLLHPIDSSIGYAAIGNFAGSPENGVYRSTDGGETWTRLGGGLPEQATMGRIALATDPTAPSIVYALIVRSSDFNLNGLYRSLDGGDSWSLLGSLPEDLFMEAGRGQGLFNLFVEVDPTDGAVIYVGGIDLWKSTDHGASWQNLSTAAGLHEDQRDIVFDPSDPQTFYLINDSGVWRSSDGGQRFTNLNGSLAVTQFQTVGLHPGNPSLAVGGTQDNGTILYRGGFAWDQGRAGDSGAAFYESSNPKTIYTVANKLSLRRSDDGGQTFHSISEGLDPADRVLFYPPFLADSSQPGLLYFATHRVWQSRDQGDHWTPLSRDLTGGGSATISALTLAPSGSQVLYVGTSDGRVQISRDGGRSWSPSSPLPDRFVTSIAVDPQSPQRAFVGLSGFGTGHVFRTENRGGNWIDISRNLPDIPVNAVLIDPVAPQTVYLGTDIGVFVLAEDGTWSPFNQGMPNVIVLGLSINPATGLMVAATHGRSAFGLAWGEPARSAPHLGAILNAAGFERGPLAPGMAVALFGSNLASTTASPANPFPFPVPFPIPFVLGGVAASVNGVSAPLFFVSPGQVNLLVPYDIQGPMAEVKLRNEGGEASVRIPLAAASPGIFQSGAEGSIFHGDGRRISEAAPAQPGEILVLFGGGLGAVAPAVANGFPAPLSPLAKTTNLPVVTVGGIPAEVLFSGLSPGWIGLYQINFVVPARPSSGSVPGVVPVVVEVAGSSSNSVTIHMLP